MADQWIVNCDSKLENVIQHITKLYNEKKFLKIEITTGMQRTAIQNAALHKYCSLLAEALNDAGFDMKKVLTKKAEIPWSQMSVKEYLWRPIQEAMINKESTADADRKDYSDIYDVLNRHLVEKFKVSVPWPSRENMI